MSDLKLYLAPTHTLRLPRPTVWRVHLHKLSFGNFILLFAQRQLSCWFLLHILLWENSTCVHSEVAKGNFSVSCTFFTTGLAKNKTKFSFIKAHKVLVSISVLYIAYNVSLTALKKGYYFNRKLGWTQGNIHSCHYSNNQCFNIRTNFSVRWSWLWKLKFHLNGEGDKAVVLVDVALQDVWAWPQNTFKACTVQLDTLERSPGHHCCCTRPIQQQRYFT